MVRLLQYHNDDRVAHVAGSFPEQLRLMGLPLKVWREN
jgi:hypothetical protein